MKSINTKYYVENENDKRKNNFLPEIKKELKRSLKDETSPKEDIHSLSHLEEKHKRAEGVFQ